MVGEYLESLTTPDGFKWELYRIQNNFGPDLFCAIHPITGERLLGGSVSDDPDEIRRVMDLPR